MQGSGMRRIILATTAIVIAVAGVALWVRNDSVFGTGGMVKTSPTGARDPVTPAPTEGAGTASADDHGAHDGHGHDHSDDMPNIDLRPIYFQPPALRDDRRFAAADTPLLVEPSCNGKPQFAQDGTAEQRLQSLYALDAAERFPQDLFYRSMIQFWRYGGQYYQLSAIWDIGIPPVYKLQLYRSQTADFSGAVVEESLPGPLPGVADAAAASDYLGRVTRDFVGKGASLGLQLVETEWPAAEGQGRIRATLANGRAVGWSFPGGYCRFDAAAAGMRCKCPLDSDRPPGKDEQPGTS